MKNGVDNDLSARIRWAQWMAAAAVAAVVVLMSLGVPLADDDLFWWGPRALLVAQEGPGFEVTLPEAALVGGELPRQWAGGLPDYGHPPLWYWWLGGWIALFGGLGAATAIHLAVLPFAIAIAIGGVELTRRLGGPLAGWGAVALPLLPALVSQLQAADTDIPLLAFSLFALVALIDGRHARFALFAAIATWSKEPGVLLVVPAIALVAFERRWRWSWTAPLLALGAWGLLHHAVAGWGFAGSERLPNGFAGWFSDTVSVFWIVFGEQGRWVLWALVLLFGRQRRFRGRVGALVVGSHLLAQLLFYSSVNFLGGDDREDRETHLRYLNAPLVESAALGLALLPSAAIPLSLLSIHWSLQPSPWGPEGSLCGPRTSLAAKEALAEVGAMNLETLWVGSYLYTQATRPFAGAVEEPIEGLHVYGPDTTPGEVHGYLLEAMYGEPLGRLQELELVEERRFGDECGWVRLLRVEER